MSSLYKKFFRLTQSLGFLAILGLPAVVPAQRVAVPSVGLPQQAHAVRDNAAHPEAGGSGEITQVSAGNLQAPHQLAVDASGNVYIADTQTEQIVEVSSDGSSVTAVAGMFATPGSSGDGGPATSAELDNPYGIAVDVAGNLYIADTSNNKIRRVSATSGKISTFAGDGTAGFSGDGNAATSAELSGPEGVAVDSAGNVYIADTGNAVIRMVSASTGKITTVAGKGQQYGYMGDGGQATNALLDAPVSVAIDSNSNLYIADTGAPSIRKVSGGIITTIAGDGATVPYSGDGPATGATLEPFALFVDHNGNLFVALGPRKNANRVVELTSGNLTTIVGDGTAGNGGIPGPVSGAELDDPEGVAADSSGNLYISTIGTFTGISELDKVTFNGASKPTVSVTPASFSVTTAQALSVQLTVSGGSGAATPTGSVTLSTTLTSAPPSTTAYNNLGEATLSNGTATITIPAGALAATALAPGSYAIIATYTPDSASSSVYQSASATSSSVTVTQAVPTVTVTPSATTVSSALPLTVAVNLSYANGSAVPTGSVILTSGSYASAATTLSGGSASITIPGGSLTVGTDTLTVSYTPDSASASLYGDAVGTGSVVVTSGSNVTPTVTVTPSPSPVTTAESLNVAVVVNGASGKPTPTGTVTLTSGTYTSGGIALSAGKATFTVGAGALPLGTDVLTVDYAPDTAGSANYNSSTGTASITVIAPPKITPTVSVTPSSSNVTTAQAVSVAITVTGGPNNPTPTGSVMLTAGSSYSSPSTPLSNGIATIVIPFATLPPGSDTLVVSYVPDTISATTFSGASGMATVKVAAVAKSTPGLTLSTVPVVGITTSDSVIVTIALSGSPAPTGTVTLTSSTYTSPATALYVGSAAITIPAGTLPAGTNTLNATYTPDAQGSVIYNSSSGTEQISVAPTGDFSVSNTSSTLTIGSAGTSASTTITITPTAGFTGQINLTCSVTTSLSIYTDLATCSLGSSGTTTTSLMVTPTAPASTTLTVSTTAASTSSRQNAPLKNFFLGGGGATLAAVFLMGLPGRRRRWRMLIGNCLVLVAAGALFAGCGSNSATSTGGTTNTGTTPGPYLVIVTGSDAATGSITSTNSINVVVK